MKTKNIYLSIAVLFISIVVFAQKPLDKSKQYEACIIGFYNIENLFDTIIDPDTTKILQDDFTPGSAKNWNTDKYYKKLTNLDEVISQIGTEISPDGLVILGLGEVENIDVLNDLVKQPKISSRNYQPVLIDGSDRRGIDVGLLYNPTYFTLESSKTIPLRLADDPGFRTRDQLLVSGTLLGEPIHIIVAHWPSRRGGEKKSAPMREAAADLGRHIIDSLTAIDPNVKIVYMGDLNDTPLNNSVKKHIKTVSSVEEIKEGYMFNPMEDLHKKGIGSHAYRGEWSILDQMMFSPGITNGDYSSFSYYGAKIFNKEFLKNQSGNFKGQPFRTYGGSDFLNGYSDHFPVYSIVIREKK